MANNRISVDDILRELDASTHDGQPHDPQSNMEQVNDIIEQILLEKKNKELKDNNETLNHADREQLEREIKIQTKGIAKLYEKAKKENTRKLKKQEREEIEIKKELKISDDGWEHSFALLEKELEKSSTQPIKLTTIHPDQKVKLEKPIEQITASLPNKEKIEAYKQSAHIDHIKREAMNITSHFGGFKEQEAPQSEMNINSYRKYKQSRNEKIGSFVLDSTENKGRVEQKDKKEKPHIMELKTGEDKLEREGISQPNPPDMESTVKKVPQSVAKFENNYDDEEDSYSFASDENKNVLITMLRKKLTFARISTIGMLILTINAIIMLFVKLTPQGLTLFNKVSVTPDAYVLCNLVLIVVALIFSFGVIKNTFSSLATRESTKDVLYMASALVCVAVNVMLFIEPKNVLESGVHMYTPVVVISLFFNSLSNLIMVGKANRNLNYILENDELYTVSLVENDEVCTEMTKGVVDGEVFLAKNVKTNLFTNFIENSFKSNRADDFCSKTCVLVFPLSLIIGIGVYLLSKNIYVALSVFSCIMTVTTTFIGGLLVAFPLKDTSKIIEHFAKMSPCSDSIIQLEDTNSVLLDAYDIFPKGTVKLQGIKTFSGKRIDNAILDAASVLCECKSALSHVFLDVIANNKEILKNVDSILYEDLMGISAWVDNKRVLIGNRDLMVNHSIAVPKKDYEDKYKELNQDIVYIAAEGELCAAFIIGVTTKKGIYDAINLLKRNNICFVLKSVDALFTSERIAAVFGIDEDKFKLLPSRLHKSFLSEHEPKPDSEILIGNNGSLLGFIISLVTTKKLSSCIMSGIVLNTFSIIIGIILICVLYFFDQIQILTAMTVAIYLAVFSLIYWLYQKNTHI